MPVEEPSRASRSGTRGLLAAALRRSEAALAAGSLVPLRTELLEEPTLAPFQVRRLLSRTPKHLREPGPRPNPFLPWDRTLEVARFETGHVVLLNKYPVQSGHLLLITDRWQPQHGWLGAGDWQAMTRLEHDTPGLWFFNSCAAAGASQPHRHLQLLPRPDGAASCPLEASYRSRLNGGGALTRLSPWRAVISRRQATEPAAAALELQGLYARHLAALGCGAPERLPLPSAPYNLLIAPEWLLTIRRRCESLAGISVNALGFAGYLLTTGSADLAWLRRHGGEGLLEGVVAKDP